MDKTLIYLNQVSDALEYTNYEMIFRSIADMRDKPATIAILPKGSFIDRVRINKNGEIFSRESDVSYINDPDKLNNRTEYGRANLPTQAMFYGAVPSTLIKMPRAVAYFETSELFSSNKLNTLKDVIETFTHSRWRVIEDIQLHEIVFSDGALKVNPDLQAALKHHMETIQGHAKQEHFVQQLRFFSNQFSRVKIYSDNEYKISCAYANYVLATTQLSGIAYPSVASCYQGQNVVLKPEAVDKYLRLESLSMSTFKRENNVNLPVIPIKNCFDLGPNNECFKWESV